ncbi:hypothetical protein EYF80_045134 [Liparis tanakae]|uniref:Secreted protein n=1 Tax=Liparis tanakae TaxID=230148 RepID=A0A4Z2FTX0_9TELE|nr:hypothetical protein EYF80_045134 [Liparis tanakae]
MPSFLEVPLSPLLVLLLSEQAVLPEHVLLHADLQELCGQTLLLLSLTRQALHQLLLPLRLLQGEAEVELCSVGRRLGHLDNGGVVKSPDVIVLLTTHPQLQHNQSLLILDSELSLLLKGKRHPQPVAQLLAFLLIVLRDIL